MLDMSRIWKKIGRVKEKKVKNDDFRIYSYRVYSVPIQKNLQLKVTARKKILSPVPSVKTPKLAGLSSGFNRTGIFAQSFMLKNGKEDVIKLMPESPASKIKWAEKHFSCYQQSHVRSRSIQNDYKKVKERKASLMNTCEISLQTFN